MKWLTREKVKVDRVAHGFSALGLSDPEILQREFIVCDGLFAGCRRRVSGIANS
jgi:hypothetical protein